MFRGLEPGTNEELLVKGVSKLYKTKAENNGADARVSKKAKISSTTNESNLGAKEGSLRRVLLVRDRASKDSWRYGFAEFNSADDAQAAMAKFKSLDKFTISSKPVLVSYVHAGVFIPVPPSLNQRSSSYTFSPLNNSAAQLMYWDESAYVSELATTARQDSVQRHIGENKRTRLAATAVTDDSTPPDKDGELRRKKRKGEKETKVVAQHLQFWSNQHAELHALPKTEGVGKLCVRADAASFEGAEITPRNSFADLQRKCCLLCSRQFKTVFEVEKHERSSQLHRDNLNNPDLVSKAAAKLDNVPPLNADNLMYRDRAQERRKVYNQPKQPAQQKHQQPINDVATEPLPLRRQSKGAALLGKMGWTAGEGLGAQGDGRTDAIQTNLYIQGVGLGAEGGKMGDAIKEAERQTKGSYSDFLDKGKERAKARFEKLGS